MVLLHLLFSHLGRYKIVLSSFVLLFSLCDKLFDKYLNCLSKSFAGFFYNNLVMFKCCRYNGYFSHKLANIFYCKLLFEIEES